MTTRFAALAVFSHVIAQYYSIHVRHAAFNAFSLEVFFLSFFSFLLSASAGRDVEAQKGR